MSPRWFGSLSNRLMEESAQPKANVGDGVTITAYTDAYAATVIEVSEKRIIVQEDRAIRTDKNGMSDLQSYRYERNPDGRLWVFTLRKNGRWIREGDSTKNPGNGLLIGHRRAHHDHGF